jgi:hypothetical protein
MKYAIISAFIIAYAIGCYTPSLVNKAHEMAVEMAFEWSSTQKFKDTGYALPERREITELFERVQLQPVKGINK